MAPEKFIPSAISGSCTMPIGLFIVGWTTTAEIHRIFPFLGATMFSFGGFFFQALYSYSSMSL